MILSLRKRIGGSVGRLLFLLSFGLARLNWSGSNAEMEGDAQDTTTISQRHER